MDNFSLKYRIESVLFNGYVAEPIPMFIWPCIVGIALLSLALWGTYEYIFTSYVSNASELTQECIIVEYEHSGPIYRLKSNSGNIFDLPADSIANEAMLSNMVSDSTPVYIECVQHKHSPRFFDAMHIMDSNGVSIVSRESILECDAKNTQNALLILWSVCSCYYAFAIGAYYILCNAPRFPRIASLLVRPQYRNF